MHTVCETGPYLSAARAAALSDEARAAIVDSLAADPRQGVEISGSGGCRKFRFAGRGKGKSGGYRVVTFYTGPSIPVFLLTVFSKGERASLSPAEVGALSKITKAIVATYRARRQRPAHDDDDEG